MPHLISSLRFSPVFFLRAAMPHVDQHQLGFRGVRALLGRVDVSVKAKLKAAPPAKPADAEALVREWSQEAAAAADTKGKGARQSHTVLSPLLAQAAKASAAQPSITRRRGRRDNRKRKRSSSSSAPSSPAAEPVSESMQEEASAAGVADEDARSDPDLHGTAAKRGRFTDPSTTQSSAADEEADGDDVADFERELELPPGERTAADPTRSAPPPMLEERKEPTAEPSKPVLSPLLDPPAPRATRAFARAREERDMEAVLRASQTATPAHHAVTPEQHAAYDARLQQVLTATGYQRRNVAGNGDCVFEAVRLACQAANILLPAPLESASELRVFIANWIRQHKEVLYALSGGDDTWRGDWFTPRASGRRSPKQLERRRTLDDCLDLLADTDERSYDISWQSAELGAHCFNLGDVIPQLTAHALGLRIVLVQALVTPTVAGERSLLDDSLVQPSSREIMLIQGVRQNHWDAALPPQSERAGDIRPPSAALGLEQAPGATQRVEVTPPTTPSRSSVTTGTCDSPAPATVSSALSHAEERSDTSTTDGSAPGRPAGDAHRIYADPPPPRPEPEVSLAVLHKSFEARAAFAEMEQKQRHRASEIVRFVCRLQQRVRTLEATHIPHRTRIQDLNHDEDAVSALLQLQLAEQGQLSQLLLPLPLHTHAEEADGHVAALLSVQPDLRDVLVSPSMLAEWKANLELIEDALAAPFRAGADPADCVEADAAERVCVLLRQRLRGLRQAAEPSLVERVLLLKLLQCVDQLRPSTKFSVRIDSETGESVEERAPRAVCELSALLCRALLFPSIFPLAVRMPMAILHTQEQTAHEKLFSRCAELYRVADSRATSLAERTRLLAGLFQLFEEHPSAKDLSPPVLADDAGTRKVALLYRAYQGVPEVQQTLQRLHTHAPTAGPPPTDDDLLRMERRDAAARVLAQLGSPADEAMTPVAVATVAAAPFIDAAFPRVRLEKLVRRSLQSFADCKNAWRRAFYPDKNQHVAWELANEQSSQVLEAWKTVAGRTIPDVPGAARSARAPRGRALAAEAVAQRASCSISGRRGSVCGALGPEASAGAKRSK